jgi:hypothetical protein
LSKRKTTPLQRCRVPRCGTIPPNRLWLCDKHEREWANVPYRPYLTKAAWILVLAEREACAAVLDTWAGNHEDPGIQGLLKNLAYLLRHREEGGAK